MSLSDRGGDTCLHYLPPSGHRQFRYRPCLLSHRPLGVRTLRLQCAPSGLWGFTLTVRPAFGNRTSFLCALVVVRRSKQRLSHWIVDAIMAAYTSQGLECPLHIRAYSTRAIASSWAWSRGMSIQDICLAAGWSSQNTFARFYKLDVQSLASQVLSVSNWFMLLPLFVDVLLVQYYSTQPSMLLLLSTLSSVPRTWSCYGMRIWYTWGVGTHWLISTYQLWARLTSAVIGGNGVCATSLV